MTPTRRSRPGLTEDCESGQPHFSFPNIYTATMFVFLPYSEEVPGTDPLVGIPSDLSVGMSSVQSFTFGIVERPA